MHGCCPVRGPVVRRPREGSVAVAANANDALEVMCKKLIRSEDT